MAPNRDVPTRPAAGRFRNTVAPGSAIENSLEKPAGIGFHEEQESGVPYRGGWMEHVFE